MMQDKKDIGKFVKIKEKYAFDVISRFHYGEIIDECTNEFRKEQIKIKSDLRYTHDSFIWINKEYYDMFEILTHENVSKTE